MPSKVALDPLLGQIVDGRYEIQTLLGEGGMGKVYKVRHVALQRHFAMKVLRKELAADRELALRFEREARAAARVQHPNVVAITDFGTLEEGIPFFVMELLVGQTLGRELQEKVSISVGRSIRIMHQVADGVAAAHEAGIVHRDLKPDNIFLCRSASGDETEVIKVLDFGAAQVMGASRLTRQGHVFGTPCYMAPEQAQGSDVDLRSDVYALGVILYELITGRVPFDGDTIMGIVSQHLYATPLPPSTLVTGTPLGHLEEVILRAMAKTPGERYASARDLGEALVEASHEHGGCLTQVTPLPRGRITPRPPAVFRSNPGLSEHPTLDAIPRPQSHPSLPNWAASDRPLALPQRPAIAMAIGALSVLLVATGLAFLPMVRNGGSGTMGTAPSGKVLGGGLASPPSAELAAWPATQAPVGVTTSLNGAPLSPPPATPVAAPAGSAPVVSVDSLPATAVPHEKTATDSKRAKTKGAAAKGAPTSMPSAQPDLGDPWSSAP
jgi:serine/threonine-protein kinase